jgi:cell division protein FtsB
MTTTTGARLPETRRATAQATPASPPTKRVQRPARPPRSPRSPQSSRPPQPARPRPARRPAAPPRTPFVLLIVGLLGGALVSLLLLNTVLAQDAFELSRLQASTKQLEQQRQSLELDIAREEAPAQLSQKARNLGMVQPTDIAFIDPQTRSVVGGALRPVPQAAAAAAGAAGVIGVPGTVIPGDRAPVPGRP